MNTATVAPPSARDARILWLILTVWLFDVVWASSSGVLQRLGQHFMPAFALLVALGIGLPVVAYLVWPIVRRSVDAIGLHRLTLLHIWRIPAALMFFHYGVRGELPTAFWVLAGVGDLLAGCFAATLLWAQPTLSRYRRIHLFGFADFVIAVGTGLTFTLLQDPRMALLTTLPMVLIPLFGVGLSGASHIIALRLIARASTAATINGLDGTRPQDGSKASVFPRP